MKTYVVFCICVYVTTLEYTYLLASVCLCMSIRKYMRLCVHFYSYHRVHSYVLVNMYVCTYDFRDCILHDCEIRVNIGQRQGSDTSGHKYPQKVSSHAGCGTICVVPVFVCVCVCARAHMAYVREVVFLVVHAFLCAIVCV